MTNNSGSHQSLHTNHGISAVTNSITDGTPIPNAPMQLVRMSTRTKKSPAWMTDFITQASTSQASLNADTSVANTVCTIQVSPSHRALLASIENTHDPATFSEAVQEAKWCEAMNSELRALEDNGTWEVTPLPQGKRAIGYKWIYRTKFKSDGSIEKHKARLVVLGCKQKYGVDYWETFSPIAKMTTVRTLLAVASAQQWSLCQMDVSNAFLHGDLKEEVYMAMPLGYAGFGHPIQPPETSAPRGRYVCKLLKSLYGLKQAPRQWFEKLSSTLIKFGFCQSKADYTLFTKKNSKGFTAVLIYVDDMVITGSAVDAITELKGYLSHQFHMKDLGELSYFLGLEVSKTEEGIFLCQKKYVGDLLKETRIENCKPLKVPLTPNLKLLGDTGHPLEDPNRFRRLVGKLIYLSITRPDISFAVQFLSKFMSAPTDAHMKEVYHLLRYLKATSEHGILLAKNSDFHIRAYCDSDWGSCPNSRKSVTGFAIMLGNSLISWKSKKQGVVARSTAEGEYRAMATTCCELTWLLALLRDLTVKPPLPMHLFCDNQAALYIVKNLVFHEQTKHIEVDCHYVRDQFKNGQVRPCYVSSKSQLADLFTKVVSASQYVYLLGKLGVVSSIQLSA